ncbi:MAG: hypothetical protein B1H40_04485 [Candidatus Latescibacteria bacterium 4484_181]|nr:MAG: hypothetical protein B1H40_04485 [Candidatus Latescibacteria bacterium 4484_181]
MQWSEITQRFFSKSEMNRKRRPLKREEVLMQIQVFESKQEMAKAAAAKAAKLLKEAIDGKGTAAFIAATGTSQFEFLENLTAGKNHYVSSG